ncbi:hypothetical protein G7Y31_11100 [Corynebacterium lizhenjunii]|uniref:Protein kinase domain-containing protein n=2 Tax=Corynebacterium lizhenjunii TaxID=2709394 RepID=A0A7T0KDZ2_9CORY|nr:hypothetical protein [Corynebacterium lizhenjunii]QPK79028.1 hypothetical protein G7Y31_11100 [Corynebacterium lizhenjunii]
MSRPDGILKLSDSTEDCWEFYNTGKSLDGPAGFKIHVNFSAVDFDRGKQILLRSYNGRGVEFKICNSAQFCERLNAGYYGVTQVGKAVTIYVSSADRLLAEVRYLTQLLVGFTGPCPPTDLRVPQSGTLSYRWAARTEPMTRSIGSGVPSPVQDPLCGHTPVGNPFAELKKEGVDLIITASLRQGAKGAVYEGFARGVPIGTSREFRPIVLKEFRKNAVKSELGHDSWCLGESEIKAYTKAGGDLLPELLWHGISNESMYLLLEAPIGFQTLHDFVKTCGRDDIPDICVRVRRLVDALKDAGIVWLDVSPSNILIDEHREMKAIDFESFEDETGITYYSLQPLGSPITEVDERLEILREKLLELIE